MAVENFIAQIWEARLLAKFHERSIASLITTAPEQIVGNKIIFNNVSNVAISNYTGSVSWNELSTSKVELPMDIKKYWAFKVDDVAKIQAAGNLIDPHVEEAASSMADEMDKAVLTEALRTSHSVEKSEGETIYDVIVKANMELNKRKVPKTNRFAVINAAALASLNLDPRFTLNYKILETGVVEGGEINGTALVFSEELNAGTEAVVVLHKSAIGFGTQLEETEAMRLHDSFADGVRGLSVAGTKTLRTDGVVKYTQA